MDVAENNVAQLPVEEEEDCPRCGHGGTRLCASCEDAEDAEAAGLRAVRDEGGCVLWTE